MMLVLTALAMLLVGGGVAATSAVRRLAEKDHRCAVRTAASGCAQCDDVLDGHGRGGHVRCACGATSAHLHGIQLLTWRAEHVGERLPGQGQGQGPSVVGPAAARLGEAAQLRRSMDLMERQGEAQRRAIARARRNPNPISAQLLREAGLDASAPADVTATTAAPETASAATISDTSNEV